MATQPSGEEVTNSALFFSMSLNSTFWNFLASV
jgi:hypothetical protein